MSALAAAGSTVLSWPACPWELELARLDPDNAGRDVTADRRTLDVPDLPTDELETASFPWTWPISAADLRARLATHRPGDDGHRPARTPPGRCRGRGRRRGKEARYPDGAACRKCWLRRRPVSSWPDWRAVRLTRGCGRFLSLRGGKTAACGRR